MSVKVVDRNTGKIVLFAASERIAREWLAESDEAPQASAILDNDVDVAQWLARVDSKIASFECSQRAA